MKLENKSPFVLTWALPLRLTQFRLHLLMQQICLAKNVIAKRYSIYAWRKECVTNACLQFVVQILLKVRLGETEFNTSDDLEKNV